MRLRLAPLALCALALALAGLWTARPLTAEERGVRTASLAPATSGRPWAARLEAVGFAADAAWVVHGAPSWLRSDADGWLWGTPHGSGDSTRIEVRVRDARGAARKSLLLSSRPAPGSPACAPLPEPRGAAAGRFRTSQACAVCHSASERAEALRDPAGEAVGPYDLWSATAMAHSARDPIFRAVLAIETARLPDERAAIEDKCLTCHAPMARAEAAAAGERQSRAALDERTDLAALGMDGVSCSLCHQIEPRGLGTAGSFSGNFQIGAERLIYGPHPGPFERPMLRHTGYRPRHAEHISSAALCATCHTLYTAPRGAEPAPLFPEQTPYLEWRNSDFGRDGTATSCQTCHMPGETAAGPIRTRLARNPGGFDFPPLAPREPFHQHSFGGANTLLLELLREQADILRPQAPEEALDAQLERVRSFLADSAAGLAVEELGWEDGELVVRIRVANRAGHKLPTAYPSRRVWLELQVLAEDGRRLFASGRCDERGRIVDAGDVPLCSEAAGGPIEPHREEITRADQVQIYEAVMADRAGAPSFLLLDGAAYAKDTRLLPAGWRDDSPEAADIQPVGASSDEDFAAGGDVVGYRIGDLDGRAAEVRVRLLYQPLGARHYHELLRWEHLPQVAWLRDAIEAAPRPPEVLGTLRVPVP